MSYTTEAEAIEGFKSDSNKVHEILTGDENTSVVVDSTYIPTFLKMRKDLLAQFQGITGAITLQPTPWNASSGSFPTGANAGYQYIVSVAGTVSGVTFNVGDSITSLQNGASTSTLAGNWFHSPTAGGGGSSQSAGTSETLSKAVTQNNHGFSVLSPVLNKGSWVSANNTVDTLQAHWVVTEVVDANNFVVSRLGEVTVSGHGLTDDNYYWVSGTGYSSIRPSSGYQQPLFFVIDANTLFIDVGVTSGSNSTISSDATYTPFTGTSYILSASDKGAIVTTANSSPVTITADANFLTAGFNCEVRQKGSGQVTFTTTNGAVLHNFEGHSKTAGQGATVAVDTDDGINLYLVGQTSA